MRHTQVAVALAASALVAACARADPPRLEITGGSVGEDTRRSAVEARYELRNAGGRALMIDGLVPACGCAATASLPATLAPQATTALTVRCRAPRTAAEVVRELRLRSSDPARPETDVRVVLAGDRPGPEPPALYLGYVAIGSSATRDVVLPEAAVADGLPQPSDPTLTIEPLPASAGGRSGVRVRFAPRVAGVMRAALDLGPTAGVVTVAGVGYGSVLAFPAEIRLPSPASAGSVPMITLMGLGDDPLEITRIEYPPGLDGELRAVIPGRQFRLVLRVHGRAAPGDASVPAAIRLRTGASEEPEVTIPVVRTEVAAAPGRAP